MYLHEWFSFLKFESNYFTYFANNSNDRLCIATVHYSLCFFIRKFIDLLTFFTHFQHWSPNWKYNFNCMCRWISSLMCLFCWKYQNIFLQVQVQRRIWEVQACVVCYWFHFVSTEFIHQYKVAKFDTFNLLVS